MTEDIPLVEYLVLDDDPHLVAQECTACGARFFGRRNGCASCSGEAFRAVAVPTEGTVTAFTIVSFAAPGIDTPFVAAIVDCGGTAVRANVVGVPADPEHVRLGLPVALTTVDVGTDVDGTRAVGFAFTPVA